MHRPPQNQMGRGVGRGAHPAVLQGLPVPPHRGTMGFLPSHSPGQFAYPPIYHPAQKPIEAMRQIEDMRRDEQTRKRPSMMSDFHLASHHMDVGRRGVDAGRNPTMGIKMMDSRRGGPAYTPQVEAISPTPEDQPEAGSRAQIGEKLERVEREIRGVDQQIKNLERKKQELEHSASGGVTTIDEGEDEKMSLFQRIYAENRKKAAASHALLAKLGGPPMDSTPLYREPSDNASYHEIKRKFDEEFRPRLYEYLKKLNQARHLRERYLSERYDTLHQNWKKKVERAEKNPKRIAKEQRNREIFERVFPELKKQREERERGGRIDTRTGLIGTRTEELHLELLSGQEEEERKLRQQAVVPPILLDARSREKLRYINNNPLVREPLTDHQFQMDTFHACWTEEEKRAFKEKLLLYGKNFAAIAVFLDRKSTQDCVRYYYLTKKRENYKQLMRKQFRGRGRGKLYRPPQIPRLNLTDKDDGQDVGESESTTARPEPEHHCVLCKVKIESTSNPGRILTRACYEQYGLEPTENPQDLRICQKCRLPTLKKKYLHCPIGTCTTVKRKVKPTRPMPAKWRELSAQQKAAVSSEYKIPEDVVKCCSSCHKKITRAVEIALEGGENQEPAEPVVGEDSNQGKAKSVEPPVKPHVPGIEESEDEEVTEDEESRGFSVKKEPPPEAMQEEEAPQVKQEVVEEVKIEVVRSQGSSGESNATLSADEGQSENESGAVKTSSVQKARSETSSPAVYKPRFAGRQLEKPPLACSVQEIINSSISRHTEAEGLQARQQGKILTTATSKPETTASPDIEIIEQKAKPERTPGRMMAGSLTQGTPIRPTATKPLGLSPVARHQLEGTLRPATPLLSRPEEPRTEPFTRVSPLVFAGSEAGTSGLSQSALLQQSLANPMTFLAQQQYWKYRQAGYPDAAALSVYHQMLREGALLQQQQPIRQMADDFRTSLQIPRSSHSAATQAVLHQQNMYKQAVEARQAEEQRQRALLQEQQQRIAQEQHSALLMAKAAEHQRQAALIGHRMAAAAAAEQQMRECAIAAAVAEHNSRALATASSRSSSPSRHVKQERPASSLRYAQPTKPIKQEPQVTKQSVIQEPRKPSMVSTGTEAVPRRPLPLSKGAMKEFPPCAPPKPAEKPPISSSDCVSQLIESLVAKGMSAAEKPPPEEAKKAAAEPGEANRPMGNSVTAHLEKVINQAIIAPPPKEPTTTAKPPEEDKYEFEPISPISDDSPPSNVSSAESTAQSEQCAQSFTPTTLSRPSSMHSAGVANVYSVFSLPPDDPPLSLHPLPPPPHPPPQLPPPPSITEAVISNYEPLSDEEQS